MQKNLRLTVDFSGGLDLVFDNRSQIKLELPENSTIDTVVKELADKHANSKKEMFAVKGVIKPGILVLINDVDWELCQKEATILEDKDQISIISTLHGG